MSYECTICGLEKTTASNFAKHIKSAKHTMFLQLEQAKQTNEQHVCNYCKRSFMHAKTLTSHYEKCKNIKNLQINYENKIVDIQNQYENKINELQSKHDMEIKLKDVIIASRDSTIATNDTTIKKLETDINYHKSEVEYIKSVLNASGTILNKSVSTLQYLINTYKTSPPFKILDDISTIENNGGDYENTNPDNNDPVTKNTLFVEHLILKFKNQLLVKYLGDFLIVKYKKGDLSQQSLWNSDVSRLSYIVRHKLNDNSSEWKTDKKGVITQEIAIDPLLKYIGESIIKYYASPNMQMDPKATCYDALHERLGYVTQMKKYIEEKIISPELLKYIAPFFYLTKEDNLMCIK